MRNFDKFVLFPTTGYGFSASLLGYAPGNRFHRQEPSPLAKGKLWRRFTRRNKAAYFNLFRRLNGRLSHSGEVYFPIHARVSFK